MVSTLTTQRLFAFCILLKGKQRNGVVFISDSRRKQASKLGMSLDSFNKYLNRAIDQELFINSGSNLQMIGTSQILKKLGLLPKSKNFHFLLNLQDCKKMNLSQLTEWVRESLVLYSFVQQQYKINKALEQIQSLEDFLNPKKTKQVKYSFFKRMQKKSAQLGISLPEYLKRVKKAQKKVVVTGSQHLSKSFKNCSSTMNKAINKLAQKGMIKRDIKKVPLKEFDLSNASFDNANISSKSLSASIEYSSACKLSKSSSIGRWFVCFFIPFK